MVDSLDNPQLPDLKDAVQIKSIKRRTADWRNGGLITANWSTDIDRGDLESAEETV